MASHDQFGKRITQAWPDFQGRRRERLIQRDRYGTAAEKVAENILQDLFTSVLGWPLSGLNYQVGYADMVITQLGIKKLIVEVKCPGSLAWNQQAVTRALEQAWRYADEQKVLTVAISDGNLLYACDRSQAGGHRDRLLAHLDAAAPPADLWWLSAEGIYRRCPENGNPAHGLLPPGQGPSGPASELVDAKHHRPARCFAYVGDRGDPATWALPYREVSGAPDTRRLTAAIRSVVSNYRGTRVKKVPEAAIPDALVNLGRAAAELGKLPAGPASLDAYRQLQQALDQFGRIGEVIPGAG